MVGSKCAPFPSSASLKHYAFCNCKVPSSFPFHTHDTLFLRATICFNFNAIAIRHKWHDAINISICFSTFILVGQPFHTFVVTFAWILQPPTSEITFTIFKRRSHFVIHARCSWRRRTCEFVPIFTVLSSNFFLWSYPLILCLFTIVADSYVRVI